MKPKKYKKQEIIRAYLILLILIVLSCCSSAPDAASIEVIRIKDTILKLCVDDFVNLVAFIGPEGVLLVDTGFDESSEQVKSILKEHSGGEIKYIINTHSDYDHIAGNSALRENAIVLAHTHCKSQLMEYADPEYDIHFDKALFRGAYPTVTFEEPVTLYFNGDEIQVIPLTGGHTDEDVIVYFKDSGVVCLGDMISPGTFPVVKLNNGGNAHALVENVERLISLFPEDVTFIVGHGENTTVKELRTYHDMLQNTIAIVQAAMKANMTVEEMKRRNILKDWSSFNDPEYKETTAETWIETIYRSSERRTNEIRDPILKGPYLGQKPPGMIPEVFASEVFTDFKYTFCSVFSPDGNEYYFAASRSENDKAGIYWMRRRNQKWTKPEPAPFNSLEIDHDMRFSADASQIFFQSWRPLPGSNTPDELGCLWFSVRKKTGWSEPQPVKCGGRILRAGYPDISRNGTLYFSTRDKNTRNVDIHSSRFVNGTFASPENLGNSINTEYIEGDLCVSPDERFIIVSCWERPDNTGGGESDLYISFRQSDGSWTKLINMGENINTEYIENCPTISPDERYFFFQRFDGRDKSETFWVDAKVIEELKPDELR